MFDHITLQVIEDKANHLEQEAKDLIARIVKNIKSHLSANSGDPINTRIDTATEEAIDKHLEVAPVPAKEVAAPEATADTKSELPDHEEGDFAGDPPAPVGAPVKDLSEAPAEVPATPEARDQSEPEQSAPATEESPRNG
jgi:hypothetical protein